MSAFFGFIFGSYVVVAMVVSPYYWKTRTDRSQAPAARRFTAMAYGAAWPFFAYQYYASKQEGKSPTTSSEPRAASAPGLNPFDDGPAQPNVPPTASQQRNPFDDD